MLQSSDLGIAEFTRSGGLETGFGAGDTMQVDLAGGLDGARAVVVQPDWKIIVAGFAQNGQSVGFGMVRIAP